MNEATKVRRRKEKEEKKTKGQQHPVFPCGHPKQEAEEKKKDTKSKRIPF